MNRPIAALSLSATLAAGCAGPIASHRVPVMSPSAATLTADLYVPQGAAPFPALILLHGCNGIGRNVLAWAQWLQAEGYAALVLDSFGGRGFTSICGDGSVFGGGPRSSDVFAAARYLATLPGIDQDRIGVIGWSHGGWTVLRAASYEPVYRDVRLRALVAFYPYCGEAARREGHDVTAVVYAGAHHGFDAAHIRRPVRVTQALRGRGATIAYDPRAHDDSEKRVREFLRRHLMPSPGRER